jgi:hypothetical protein
MMGMKHYKLPGILAGTALLLLGAGRANAQFSVNGGAARYNTTREYNPLRVAFKPAWDVVLPDLVKLIEIAPVIKDQDINVLMMVESGKPRDYRRTLLVTHWDGFRFSKDASTDFFGTVQDCLLVGRFRAAPKPVVVTTVVDKKAKKPTPPPSRQIVTTEGFYTWNSGGLARLYSSPPNLKLALTLDGALDQMVINSGDNSAVYEAGDADIHPSDFQSNGTESAYPRYGIGTQRYDGIEDFLPNVRYAQTYWNGRYRWQIGLLRGKPAGLRDLPDATTGDIVVVYVPKAANKDRVFLQLTRSDQYEESWRSPALPGRVLDVRVGDPKREGKLGILVLTSENDDRDRHLHYFELIEGIRRP